MMPRHLRAHFSSMHVEEHFASQNLGLLVYSLWIFAKYLKCCKCSLMDLWRYERNSKRHLGQWNVMQSSFSAETSGNGAFQMPSLWTCFTVAGKRSICRKIVVYVVYSST